MLAEATLIIVVGTDQGHNLEIVVLRVYKSFLVEGGDIGKVIISPALPNLKIRLIKLRNAPVGIHLIDDLYFVPKSGGVFGS